MNIVYLRSNPVDPDPRVEKEVSSLLKNGHTVLIFCWDRTAKLPKNGVLKVSGGSCQILRCSLASTFGGGIRGIFKLVFFQFFLICKLIKYRKSIDVIHAADFDTVLPAVMMRFFFNKKVVYDVYDFYVDSFPVPRVLMPLIKVIDLFVMGYVDAVILTNEDRIKQIFGAKPKKIIYIHNTPENRMPELGAKRTAGYKLIVAYVGILQPGRLLLEIADVFKKNPNWLLRIAGFGALENELRKVSQEYSNIEYLGKVDYMKGLQLSASADVLFATYDPNVPNHKYSSPNKLYEAMMLSKPIVVCEGTGIDALVNEEQIGVSIRYDGRSFEEALNYIIENSGVASLMGDRINKLYLSKYSWDVMDRRLIGLYNSI